LKLTYNDTETCLYHKYFFPHIINGSVYVRMYITTFIIKAGILARGGSSYLEDEAD